MRPKLYDCFCYLNEDMLLEMRLETLWAHVDYFVIVESIYTSSGKPKPLNFNPEKFPKYLSKIRYLVIRDYPEGTADAWRNELYQRNYMMHGLTDAQPEDWVMISDLDEIPRPEKIALFNPKRYKRADFEQAAYAYFLNNRCYVHGVPNTWRGAKITTYHQLCVFFKSPERMKSYKSSGPLRLFKRYWFKHWMVQVIPNGGWHFTWIASIDKIILKLESFAHQEFNLPEYKDPDSIRHKIRAGMDIINPHAHCVPEPLDARFPRYLLDRQHALAEWIIQPSSEMPAQSEKPKP